MDSRHYEVLASAYDSIITTKNWSETVDRLGHALAAKAVVLMLKERATAFDGFDAYSEAYRQRHEEFDYYCKKYIHLEEEAWRRLARCSPGVLMEDSFLYHQSREKLDKMPHYKYGKKHLGIGVRAGFRVSDNLAWTDSIGLSYDSAADIAKQDLQRSIEFLTPHLSRALELSRAVSMLRQKYSALAKSLDMFGLGIAVSLRDGQIIVKNKQADRLFNSSATVTLKKNGKLEFANEKYSRLLSEIVDKASRTASGEGSAVAPPLIIEGTSGDSPIILDVHPLNDSTGEFETELRGAILVFTDTGNPPRIDVSTFSRLYRLTPAESETCTLMSDGDSTEKISEMRGVSVNTSHNQVNAVLSKTRCQSRVQLLHLIVRTVPPILQSPL